MSSSQARKRWLERLDIEEARWLTRNINGKARQVMTSMAGTMRL